VEGEHSAATDLRGLSISTRRRSDARAGRDADGQWYVGEAMVAVCGGAGRPNAARHCGSATGSRPANASNGG